MEKLILCLFIVLGFAGLWDGFTTFYGTYNILGETGSSLLISIVFGIIITAFLFSTAFIWGKELDNEIMGTMLRALWVVAFIYDVFTSFIGNKDILLQELASFSQIAILVGITVLVSGSPIVFSYLLDKDI